MNEQLLIAAGVGGVLVVLVVSMLTLRRSLRDVPSGSALVVSSVSGDVKVRFERTVVVPLLQTAELVDITAKLIVLERESPRGIRCADGIRVRLRAAFTVRINPTAEDVNAARKRSSAASLASLEYVRQLFVDSFAQALESVAAHHDFRTLTRDQEQFKEHVMEVVGRDLGGFVLDDLAVNNIEMVPLSEMDPEDVRDAEGIQKITEVTTQAQERAAQLNMRLRTMVADLDLHEAEILVATARRQAEYTRGSTAPGSAAPDLAALRAGLDERVRELVALVQSPP